LADEDVGLLRGVDYDILAQGLIELIEYSYHQGISSFLETHMQITLELSVLGPEQFQDGWPTGKPSRVCTSEDKSAQKKTMVGLLNEVIFMPQHQYVHRLLDST
jgi:hypothetical protein